MPSLHSFTHLVRLVYLVFLKNSKYRSASGPLQVKFPLPTTCFLPNSLLGFLSSLLQMFTHMSSMKAFVELCILRCSMENKRRKSFQVPTVFFFLVRKTSFAFMIYSTTSHLGIEVSTMINSNPLTSYHISFFLAGQWF